MTILKKHIKSLKNNKKTLKATKRAYLETKEHIKASVRYNILIVKNKM